MFLFLIVLRPICHLTLLSIQKCIDCALNENFTVLVNRIMYLHKCTNLFYDLEMLYQISYEKPLLIINALSNFTRIHENTLVYKSKTNNWNDA